MNVEKAIQTLKDSGYKYTGKREHMIELFAKYNQYLTAKDALELMKEDFPGISVDTIYRNLYLLTEIGILEATELKSEKHFRFKCDTNEHHHHFICTDCGKTKSLHFCPMEQLQNSLKDFEIENHKFEIYGKCPQCN